MLGVDRGGEGGEELIILENDEGVIFKLDIFISMMTHR
jgi:hypothetical protein